ncbi:hypothetical protein [Streptomyces sp. NPDC001594]|uniref:hypothetical protein n=1 Tax=Streptomyces sp. NPDC001594 TaxID=3364590 RepID=UPI0036B49608
MSDETDEMRAFLTEAIVTTYVALAEALTKLPVPITLPRGPVFQSKELTSAVSRVVEIIKDQPIDMEIQAHVWGASLYWNAAARLLGVWLHAEEPSKVAAVEIELVLNDAADAILHLTELLDRQE